MKCIDKNVIEHKHVIWGAKEVIYKLYSAGGLDFLKHIFTDKFIYKEQGEIKGYVLKDNRERHIRSSMKKLIILYWYMGEVIDYSCKI